MHSKVNWHIAQMRVVLLRCYVGVVAQSPGPQDRGNI